MHQVLLKRVKYIFGISVGSMLFAIVLFTGLNLVYPLDIAARSGPSVSVYSAEGDVLRQFANQEGIYRIPVTQAQVSPWYLTALFEYEDKYFFSHPGVNPFSLLRGIAQHLYYGRVISGGSTLTMQVARMFYPHRRTYWGKLEQIFRAIQLELHYSKSEILALYLTYAPMGGNIEGVEAASQRYFGKHASELSPTEAVMLVVIPQRPSLYRPDRFPERALQARNKVLQRVAISFSLTPAELVLMRQSPLLASRHPSPLLAPLLARRLQLQKPKQAQIRTFIDFTIESNIETIIKQWVEHRSAALSAAVMVMENQTGKVIAYKGSANIKDLQRYGYVDMIQSWRSPGSTLKPFIYGLALDQGLVDSASLLTDVPRQFGDYSPQNFDHRFLGAIRLDEALQQSRNIPAVQVLNHVGPDTFLSWLAKAGISLRVKDANLAIALGGEGIRLTDLVTLFSALSRNGEVIYPRLSVDDPVQTAPLLSPASSWIIRNILQDIAPPDRVKAAYGRHIAWKTGTSYGYRDAWAIGSSADYTVGIWVGRPDGSPHVGQTGANQAAPLMFDVFDLLPQGHHVITKPPRVSESIICWPSGINAVLVKRADCLQHHRGWTIAHHTPPTLKKEGSDLSHLHQWPQPILNWIRKMGRPLSDVSSSPLKNSMKILTPKPGTQLFPYPGQKLTLIANQTVAQWYLDDQPLSSNLLILDKLPAGTHRISACTAQCDSREIVIY